MNIKKLIFVSLISFTITFSGSSQAKFETKGTMVTQAFEILADISDLAKDLNLTFLQKNEIKQILIGYLPSIGIKANSLLNNRQLLLDMNLNNDELYEQQIQQIANEQGNTIAEIIVLKEHMKKELRNVLSEEQKHFVDELMILLIQSRFNRI